MADLDLTVGKLYTDSETTTPSVGHEVAGRPRNHSPLLHAMAMADGSQPSQLFLVCEVI